VISLNRKRSPCASWNKALASRRSRLRAIPPHHFKLINMNAELLKKALVTVLDPHVLVNLVSRRVRQLNANYGATSRSLLADTGNLGVADIALLEIIEGKIGFDMPEILKLARPTGKNGKRPQGWKARD